ncbi:hypothetical protein JTB14_028764 [Gonioctena quinquepunctata]|nr:hypothetical protein JTB14_028764 [Gonioctena quinquepunctata]
MGYDVFITAKDEASKVRSDQILSLAQKLEIDHREYYSNVKKYISDIAKDVDFKMNNGKFTIFCIIDGKIRIKYFYCEMPKVAYNECVENLLDEFHLLKKLSMKNFDTTLEIKEQLERDKEKIDIKLQEFIERKKRDDQELYSNFVLVLNEKKRKIQHLSKLLDAFKQGRPMLNPPVVVKRRKNKKDQVKEEITVKEEVSDSDSSSDSVDYNTDGADEVESYNGENDTSLLPSTSKHDYHPLLDDSPPRQSLPKRMRIDKGAVECDISIPISSNVKNQDVKMEATSETEYNSPNVDFSTQELLDNI